MLLAGRDPHVSWGDDLALVKSEFIGRFLLSHDDELNVVAAFTDRLVTRHVLDAAVITTEPSIYLICVPNT